MDAVWVALIVAVASIFGPLLLSHLTARQRRQERREDRARQDLVVAQVAAAAADQAAEAIGKLDVIHGLVNSGMTAALQGEHAATVRELVMMGEVVALHRGAGHAPSAETLAAIEATRQHIDVLAAGIADRIEQAAVANQQETA